MEFKDRISDDDRREYQKRAVHMRQERAKVRRMLKSGQIKLGAIEPYRKVSKVIGGIRVFLLLTSLPGVGDRTAREWLVANHVKESRKFGTMGKRQVKQLMKDFG